MVLALSAKTIGKSRRGTLSAPSLLPVFLVSLRSPPFSIWTLLNLNELSFLTLFPCEALSVRPPCTTALDSSFAPQVSERTGNRFRRQIYHKSVKNGSNVRINRNKIRTSCRPCQEKISEIFLLEEWGLPQKWGPSSRLEAYCLLCFKEILNMLSTTY